MSAQFVRHVFLNVFNIVKTRLFVGSCPHRKAKTIRWYEVRRLAWLWVVCLHNTVFGQKCFHCQCVWNKNQMPAVLKIVA
jgi:hypothetical protein